MIVKIIGVLFEKLIGRIPEPRRSQLRSEFKDFILKAEGVAIESAASGLVKGAKS